MLEKMVAGQLPLEKFLVHKEKVGKALELLLHRGNVSCAAAEKICPAKFAKALEEIEAKTEAFTNVQQLSIGP